MLSRTQLGDHFSKEAITDVLVEFEGEDPEDLKDLSKDELIDLFFEIECDEDDWVDDDTDDDEE